MTKPISKNTAFLSNIFPFALPLLLMAGIAWLTQSPYFQRQPEALSLGITVDLILTIPVVYFFLIRKKNIPNTTTIPFIVAGVLLAGWLIPAPHPFYLDRINIWVLPLLEGIVLLIVIRKVRIASRHYRAQAADIPDVFTALKEAAKSVVPGRLSILLATELAVLYYGFSSWKKRTLVKHEFSYHQNSSATALFVTLIFLVLVEASVLHLLLQQWSNTVAWILSVISLYSALQLFGMVRSLGQRPIAIKEGALILRYGMLSEAIIPLGNITKVERIRTLAAPTPTLSPLGEWEELNIVIHLKETATLHQLYGFKKTFNSLAFHVDEPDALVMALSNVFGSK